MHGVQLSLRTPQSLEATGKPDHACPESTPAFVPKSTKQEVSPCLADQVRQIDVDGRQAAAYAPNPSGIA